MTELILGFIIIFLSSYIVKQKTSQKENRSHLTKSKWTVDNIRKAFGKDGRGFEMLVSKYYSLKYDRVELTQKTNDGGYDVLAQDNSEKVIIEAKMTKNNVTVNTARELIGVAQRENADKIIIVTTADLSKPGKKEFKNISSMNNQIEAKVINGSEFCNLLNNSVLIPPWNENDK